MCHLIASKDQDLRAMSPNVCRQSTGKTFHMHARPLPDIADSKSEEWPWCPIEKACSRAPRCGSGPNCPFEGDCAGGPFPQATALPSPPSPSPPSPSSPLPLPPPSLFPPPHPWLFLAMLGGRGSQRTRFWRGRSFPAALGAKRVLDVFTWRQALKTLDDFMWVGSLSRCRAILGNVLGNPNPYNLSKKYGSTPPICTAVRPPFVSPYFPGF